MSRQSAERGGEGGVALAVLLCGTFMAGLDVTIVNVAAPDTQSDLSMSGGALQLVVGSYTVAYAALLITGARLGDDHGHRRLFLIGVGGFTLASLICGLAPSTEVLIAARLMQGIAAAAMAPQVVTIIQLRYRGEARGTALALFAAVLAAGGIAGLVLGGLLVSTDVLASSWRLVFLVNVPIGIALLVLGRRFVPLTRAEAAARLDLIGVVLLTAAAALVMIPLVFGHEADWPAWTWQSAAAGSLVAILLVLHLRRLAARGGNPLVDLSLLGRRVFSLGLAAICLQMIAYGGVLFSLTLHLQGELGFSALDSGLTFVPFAVGFAATSLTCPRLRAAAGKKAAAVGLIVMAIAYGGIALATESGAWNEATVLPLLAIAGAGFGAGYSPILTRAVAGVAPARARDASGIFTTVNQLSFVLGVATVGSLFLALADSTGGSNPEAHGFAIALYLCSALGVAAAGVGVSLTRAENASALREVPEA